jgi:hypothetical protein
VEDGAGMNLWTDVLELDVQVETLSGTSGLWDVGKWNSVDKWAGLTSTQGLMWLSIYDRVTAVSFQRGRPDLMAMASTGTCQIDIINDDGWASGMAPPHQQAPLVPGRRLRVLTRPAGTEVAFTPLWTGYVDSVDAPWRTRKTANAVLRGVDAMSRLALIDKPLPTAAPRELVGDRLQRIANMANFTHGTAWSNANFIVAAGTIKENLLTEAQINAFTASCYVYADRDGKLASYDLRSGNAGYHYMLTNGTGQYGDGTWCPNVPIPYEGTSAEPIRNRIEIAHVDGGIHTYDNAQSQALYGIRPYNRTDLRGEAGISIDAFGQALLAHASWPRYGNATYDLDMPQAISLGAPINLVAVPLNAIVDVDLTLDPDTLPPWQSFKGQTIVTAVDQSITPDRWNVALTVDHPAGTPPVLPTALEELEPAWH